MIDFLSNLVDLRLSVSSRRGIINNLRVFFDWCIQENWLEMTSKKLVHRGDIPKEPKNQPRYIPNEVIEQLNKHLDLLPPYLMRLVVILQTTGRRISEICTLPFNPILQDIIVTDPKGKAITGERIYLELQQMDCCVAH